MKIKEHNPFACDTTSVNLIRRYFAHKWNNIRCPLDGLFIEVPEDVSISNQAVYSLDVPLPYLLYLMKT